MRVKNDPLFVTFRFLKKHLNKFEKKFAKRMNKIDQNPGKVCFLEVKFCKSGLQNASKPFNRIKTIVLTEPTAFKASKNHIRLSFNIGFLKILVKKCPQHRHLWRYQQKLELFGKISRGTKKKVEFSKKLFVHIDHNSCSENVF